MKLIIINYEKINWYAICNILIKLNLNFTIMKKRLIQFSILIVTAISLLSFVGEMLYRKIPNTSFRQGEFLSYRVHYGFITAGGATMEVTPKFIK